MGKDPGMYLTSAELTCVHMYYTGTPKGLRV